MDQAAKGIAPGAVVNVRGEDGRAFGTGYFNPKSLIAVRLWPMIAMLSSTAIFCRASTGAGLRAAIYDKPFYRLVHAEGDRSAGPGDRPLRRHLDGADWHRGHGTAARALLQRWTIVVAEDGDPAQ
jgi:hypothetical protein